MGSLHAKPDNSVGRGILRAQQMAQLISPGVERGISNVLVLEGYCYAVRSPLNLLFKPLVQTLVFAWAGNRLAENVKQLLPVRIAYYVQVPDACSRIGDGVFEQSGKASSQAFDISRIKSRSIIMEFGSQTTFLNDTGEPDLESIYVAGLFVNR